MRNLQTALDSSGHGTRTLVCGCEIGAYSELTVMCDKHYQRMLDERYSDPEDELPSMRDRACDEDNIARTGSKW